MPGVFQLSVDQLEAEADELLELGVPAVILFGLPETKDEAGSGAYAPDGIVQQALRELKAKAPELYVITDVCMCEYTSHGHCGASTTAGCVINDVTLEMLAQTAVSHAEAGADMVAPSDMMDGRVAAIRAALDAEGYDDDADHGVLGEVRGGLLRPVPRGGGLRARVRRPARVPDGRRPTATRRCARPRSTSPRAPTSSWSSPRWPTWTSSGA